MAPAPLHASEKTLAIQGAFWTFIGYGGSQALRLVSNLILARLLFPSAFGTMALVNVFLMGLQMISDIGLGPGIIRSPRGNDDTFLRTAWSMQVIRGGVLFLMCCGMAYPVSLLYSASNPGASQLLLMLPVAGLTAVIGGFSSTSLYTLNKVMNFRALAVMELLPQLASIVVMVLWALVNPSAWALLAGGIAYSLLRCALSHRANRPRTDGFGWDASAYQELSGFGRWIMASTLLSFLASQFDKLLLGKLLTLTELGLYTIALSFSHVAIHIANRLSVSVLYPLFAKRIDNPQRMTELCLKGRKVVLLAGGAVCAAFCIGSDAFFSLLYPHNYSGSIDIARWTCLTIWSTILNVTVDRVPLALGQSKALFQTKVVNLLLLAALSIAGYKFLGLPGFISGMALANLVTAFHVNLLYPFNRLAIAVQSMEFSLLFGLWSLVAVAMVWYMGQIFGDSVRIGFSLVLSMATMSVMIPTLLGLRGKRAVHEAI